MLTAYRTFKRSYLAQHGLCAQCRREGDLELAVGIRHRVIVGDPSLLFRADLVEPMCISHLRGSGWREPAPSDAVN